MRYQSSFNIFGEQELTKVLEAKDTEIESAINSETADYILSVSETEYVRYLVDRFRIENLELGFDDASVSTFEENIPGSRFPGGIADADPRAVYIRDVIRYHVPFTGDPLLLRCKPSTYIPWTRHVLLEDGCVCLDIIDFFNDADRIKNEVDNDLNSIKKQLSHVRDQVNVYNGELQGKIYRIFRVRKQHFLERGNLLAALDVPIRKRQGIPETFTIPTPSLRKRIRVSRPEVTEKGFKPEPTLHLDIYNQILKAIHDVGKQFERMPSTYSGKHEEELRDHFLLMLEPRFEGSATGETFNKTGKTDVLLRHENSNVFIAECKFWRGEKAFLDTISQLLGYLTWRDSKAAVIVFVKNKDFSSVLTTVERCTTDHPNYLAFANKRDESWLDYRFHLTGDPNREVRLAILLYHIPE